MRAILFVVIVAVLLLIAALATGLLRFSSGMASRTDTTTDAAAAGGPHQSRSFDVETGSVHVGSRTATVKVPRLEVTPPANTASNQAATVSDHQ